ncbi:MAG: chromosome partitioning protein ParB [Roseibaca calidilacus]|uniref:Chromosome partitioning protein ParB n=1 Tax=Roseibaca calidilacus TaxID=1666912 RepID=A0A0P7VV54_9RHOB|nr:ParB/RepB/Spo0J family partition protein [Roseibaca calidilacus]KPP90978.1 MAG: chromosome partitioning protein ParB [Roseibaca calidilacus]CUX83911.1 chromosome partitioning protein, ParB family [Roseibaca calidilacus]
MDRKAEKRGGLGRGLSALMADVALEQQASAAAVGPIVTLPVESLVPNPDQPRRYFDETALAELAASIREKGVIQPLVVRKKGESYEIVAGERRWRAAQRAQVHELPVVVREFTDTEVLEIAIIENIQRADLNAVEEAQGYRALIERFGHTQEKLAEVLGKSRSYIANLLRLLNLPEEVQALVRDGKLSAGHARALVTADDAGALARKVVAEGLSVRQVEALMKRPASGDKAKPRPKGKDSDTQALENDLSAALGMKVSIEYDGGGKGRVMVAYKNMDQLDKLCSILGTPR